VSWSALLLLAALAYAMKAAGPLLSRGGEVRPAVAQVLDLIAIPLLAALILIQTLDGGDGEIVFDARVPALGVAAILVWRRAPFLVVVLAAAATAALLRAL
jgi:hypothetical protein